MGGPGSWDLVSPVPPALGSRGFCEAGTAGVCWVRGTTWEYWPTLQQMEGVPGAQLPLLVRQGCAKGMAGVAK